MRRVAAWASGRAALVLGSVLLPATAAVAASLSGTIQYAGALGPVSRQRPIKVEVSSTPSKLRTVAHTTVSTNGGRFTVSVATAGTYYLWFFLDVNKNGHPDVGEPFQVYNQRFTLPADPITAPQSGLNLSFDDTGLLPGIAGTASYTGSLGQVSSTAHLYVEEASDANLVHLRKSAVVSVNGGRYEFVTLDSGPYYLQAFFDVNGKHRLEPGDPLTIYDNHGAPPGDPIDASPTQTGIDISFGDDNLASGAPGTPTPTATPVPCIGACGGGDTVSVNDLLVLVNIILGTAPASACPAAGATGGGPVTVGTLLAAAANALQGCAAH